MIRSKPEVKDATYFTRVLQVPDQSGSAAGQRDFSGHAGDYCTRVIDLAEELDVLLKAGADFHHAAKRAGIPVEQKILTGSTELRGLHIMFLKVARSWR